MTTELGPYLGAVDRPTTDWVIPKEEVGEEIEEPIEGEFREAPEGGSFWSKVKGKVEDWRESRGEARTGREQEFIDEVGRRGARWGFPYPETYEEARDIAKQIDRFEEFSEVRSKSKLEEEKAYLRAYKRKYRRDIPKGISKAYKAIAGPKHPVSSEFYVPKAQPGLYVPKIPAWRPTTEFMPAGEAHRPQLGILRRASSPPPSTPVRVPFRGIERFEGIGTAMGRLRQLEKFPEVDQAVYQEIHANGDIDTPSHVRKEVRQLGFSNKEIDTSLKRLRDVGLIVPTGQKVNGEKELMVTGGQNGR